tara:strand:+ start:31 stop:789 length:759 start_codon:yes stop_codon:yes gene_type:complete
MNKLFIFDFDGTLSWLRAGWPKIMTQLLSKYLPILQNETEEYRNKIIGDITFGLSGQATMVQMQHFVRLANLRKQIVPPASILYQDYLFRLNAIVDNRKKLIRNHDKSPLDFLIPGSIEFLTWLENKESVCAIVSGTEQDLVREEAQLLGISRFFGERIYGCTGDPLKYKKALIFSQLIRDTGASGNNIIAFGDGPTEIKECKRLGGYAVAICSDEEQVQSKTCDPIKRTQLLAAGADTAIPNFIHAKNIFD